MNDLKINIFSTDLFNDDVWKVNLIKNKTVKKIVIHFSPHLTTKFRVLTTPNPTTIYTANKFNNYYNFGLYKLDFFSLEVP